MRILWICAARAVGGAERATAQVLASLRARGHDVAAQCPDDGQLPALLAEHGLALRPAPLGGAFNLRARTAIAAALSVAPPDAALVTTADEWVWSCLSRRAPTTRLVLARHMALPLARRVRWLAGRRADAVVAVSDAVRDSLRRWPAIPADRLHVVYNPTRFAPRAAPPAAAERQRARQALGLPATGMLVGFFGGLDPAKGAADVARAVRVANQARGETHLLLGGRRGPGAASAADWARRFDLPGRLHEVGEIGDMATALTAADVVVMATSSRLGEALPATLIEAMACGTPVAAYAATGMAEVIGADQRAGLLARPDDAADLARAIVETLADPAAAARRAAVALARVAERFDPQRAADRYAALLRG
jgi:glycosyltransferase involved in cell wall biosynthesis